MKTPVLILLTVCVALSACRTRTETQPIYSLPPPKEKEKAVEKPKEKVAEKPLEFVGPPAPPAEWKDEFRLAALFSDNMVLQQGTATPIWGWAAEGEMVTVTFRNQKVAAKAKNGSWMVRLRNLEVGEPTTLKVEAAVRSVELTNVLVGDVWLCSGQSNMEWPLKKAFKPEEDIVSATNSLIRFFMVPNTRSGTPLSDVPKASAPGDFQSKWLVCEPKWAEGFSAVGYYFGRHLQGKRKVPIGLIQSDWGGTPAEAWMDEEFLTAKARYKKELIDPYPEAVKKYEADLAAWEKEKAEAAKKKATFTKWQPWRPWKPAELYNAMIAPLVPYAIKGAIWYQGESNAARAEQYKSLFSDLIRNWRQEWGYEFPFFCVQLAPFKAIKPQPDESDWAELREAQLEATKLPKVGIAVITDVGEEKDIHPPKKEPVGHRLALAARAMAYGEKIAFSGPIYKNVKFGSGKATISFHHVGGGLVARGNSLKGFSICGEDRKFYWALAEIQKDNTVLVWSPNVPKPIAVRYGWADFPVVNLWNSDGLPASPFRTDDFPMITDPAKKL